MNVEARPSGLLRLQPLPEHLLGPWCLPLLERFIHQTILESLENDERGAEMLVRYINSAMRRAKYEILPDDGTYYGEIPGFQGVFANATTLEDCREQLQEVLEDWILLSVAKNLPVPAVDGIELKISEVA